MTGAQLGLPYYLCILGEAFLRLERHEDARRTFAEALALVEENDERCQEAELHRLCGELAFVQANDRPRRGHVEPRPSVADGARLRRRRDEQSQKARRGKRCASIPGQRRRRL